MRLSKEKNKKESTVEVNIRKYLKKKRIWKTIKKKYEEEQKKSEEEKKEKIHIRIQRKSVQL